MQTSEIGSELELLLLEAESQVDEDDAVLGLLRDALKHPLDTGLLSGLLDRVLEELRRGATARGDSRTLDAIQSRAGALRDRIVVAASDASEAPASVITLESFNGTDPRPVFPVPVFHQQEVPMMAGFVNVRDISLWDENERLDVHVEQFQREWGREPTSDELLQIMFSQMQLPGLEDDKDEFEIKSLARSIASNGVRQPPVIALDGTLLDGNRRIAACHWVLSDPEFTSRQKARAEKVFVWQLTEHAGPNDRERVIVALNFESDNKQPWPEYVKARRIAEEWQRILELEGSPTSTRMAELKRELSMQFALGSETHVVNRYIKMVRLIDEFEEHQTIERGHDESAVKHAASRQFQYFDELQKGSKTAGGVAHTLGQNEDLRDLVFDLLFENKFGSWRDVRKLKWATDPAVLADLREARDMEVRSPAHLKEAQRLVTGALSMAETMAQTSRVLGADLRIKTFAEWLRTLPLEAFANEQVSAESVEVLMESFALAREQARPIIGKDRLHELTGCSC